jgi:hypothetical protein
MSSTFYSSNQTKLKDFVTNNRKREVNELNQQEILDAQIAKNLGLDEQATQYSNLAKRVFNKLGSELDLTEKSKLTSAREAPFNKLVGFINNGQLSDIFEKLKTLPDSILNKKQKIIKHDLNTQEFKDVVNENIMEASSYGPTKIGEALIQILGGDGNEKDVLDMINKSTSELTHLYENTNLKKGYSSESTSQKTSKTKRKYNNTTRIKRKVATLEQQLSEAKQELLNTV